MNGPYILKYMYSYTTFKIQIIKLPATAAVAYRLIIKKLFVWKFLLHFIILLFGNVNSGFVNIIVIVCLLSWVQWELNLNGIKEWQWTIIKVFQLKSDNESLSSEQHQ